MTARLSTAERDLLARILEDRNDVEHVAAVVEAILLARQRARIHPILAERRSQRELSDA